MPWWGRARATHTFARRGRQHTGERKQHARVWVEASDCFRVALLVCCSAITFTRLCLMQNVMQFASHFKTSVDMPEKAQAMSGKYTWIAIIKSYKYGILVTLAAGHLRWLSGVGGCRTFSWRHTVSLHDDRRPGVNTAHSKGQAGWWHAGLWWWWCLVLMKRRSSVWIVFMSTN